MDWMKPTEAALAASLFISPIVVDSLKEPEQSMPSLKTISFIDHSTWYEPDLTLNEEVFELKDQLQDSVQSLKELTSSLAEQTKRLQEDKALDYAFSQPHVFELTAYTLDPEENGYFGSTSSAQYELEGKYLKDRYIAVDPNLIPYHTKVYIEFPENRRYIVQHGEVIDLNGEYLAVDCGGAIQQNRIDLFVGGQGTYYDQIAAQIGRRDVMVYYPLR